MDNKEIKEILLKLEDDILMAQNIPFTGNWSDFWQDSIKKTLKITCERFKKMSTGEINVYDENLEALTFWKNIMQTFEKNLWTTNITYGSKKTFGSLVNLLLLQQETLKRGGVSIERVFVYDPYSESINQIRDTMMNQLQYGIKVYSIKKGVFESAVDSLGIKIKNKDFMLIDNQFLYQTSYFMETDSFRNRLITNKILLNKYEVIKEEIMKNAIEYNKETIVKFPKTY